VSKREKDVVDASSSCYCYIGREDRTDQIQYHECVRPNYFRYIHY
jgi:hypothetical protein